MKIKMYCRNCKKDHPSTIRSDATVVVEGQVALVAACDNCGTLNSKVIGLEKYKKEILKEK